MEGKEVKKERQTLAVEVGKGEVISIEAGTPIILKSKS